MSSITTENFFKKSVCQKTLYALSFKEGFGTGAPFDSYKCDLSSPEKHDILDTNGFAYFTTEHKPHVSLRFFNLPVVSLEMKSKCF